MPIRVSVRKQAQVQRKLDQVVNDLHGREFQAGMRQATLIVQRDARLNAPVDTGRLRSSISTSLNQTGNTIEGVVGSNVDYAPYMELGTGRFVGNSPYFPPPRALAVWARRHGMPSGWVVAYAIYKAGGTRGRFYLQDAFDKNEETIKQLLGRSVNKIVRKHDGS